MNRKEPWLAELAIVLISTYLRPEHTVFEFGSGASTLWFCNRAKRVISIEHSREFYDELKKEIEKKQPANLIPVIAARPYNMLIDAVDDNSIDLVLVDGRDRVKCIGSAIPKVKTGGWLIVDNSEREYYAAGINLMKDWNQVHCQQNREDKYGFTYPGWTTSIFIKP